MPKIVRNIVLTCVVLHNMLWKHQGRVDKVSTPGDDIAANANEAVVYLPDQTCSKVFTLRHSETINEYIFQQS